MAATIAVYSALKHCLLLILATCAVINSVPGKPTEHDAVQTSSRQRTAVTGESLPLSAAVARRSVGSSYRDTRWRMISAMMYLNDYTTALGHHNDCELVCINEEHSHHEDLEEILSHVCDLVTFYELALKVNDSIDSKLFNPLLSEIIKDSCKWVQYLDNVTDAMTWNQSVENVNQSCSADDVTILHRYCYRINILKLINMREIGNLAIYSLITDYHENDEEHITASNPRLWLNTSSLSPSLAHRIYESTVMAIIQYIIENELR